MKKIRLLLGSILVCSASMGYAQVNVELPQVCDCPPAYPPGSVFCASGPTAIVDVINPTTGETWMDRNLGASQVATSTTDAAAYGDLYQWGRFTDGHQCRTSTVYTTKATTEVPNAGNPWDGQFIGNGAPPSDWLSIPNDNLWQGVNGVNNPCPSGYRIPTIAELDAERLSWSSNNLAGALASPLKIPGGGYRGGNNSLGNLISVGNLVYLWSSNVNSGSSQENSQGISANSTNASLSMGIQKYHGAAVRCIKDVPPNPQVGALDCNNALQTGTLTENTTASGVSFDVDYTGGNGDSYAGEVVSSTGVTGLTATLSAGTLASGAGTVTYTVSGTPGASGTASFAISLGGQTCTVDLTVDAALVYPPGSVFCASGPTAIVDVINPTTGETWMDRNLGASQVATSSTDAAAYGDLYQWGRFTEGHQCRTAPILGSSSIATTAVPNAGNPWDGAYVSVGVTQPLDWLIPQNSNLWQGVNGTNNPCPSGYRLPTEAELTAERISWGFLTQSAQGAFNSPLKFTVAGYRPYNGGVAVFDGVRGRYWSSNVISNQAYALRFEALGGASVNSEVRANAFSVRCIKD